MDPKELGESLREMRGQAKMGLRELAREAGLAPASLSKIEKGQCSPTLATLHKILKVLGSDFASFFADANASENPVFPSENMRSAEDAHREYVFAYPRREGLAFELIKEVIQPGEADPEWEVHDCDMGGVLMSGGPLRLQIEGREEWTIRRGDAFYLKSGWRHRAWNTGKSPARVITVMCPPRY